MDRLAPAVLLRGEAESEFQSVALLPSFSHFLTAAATSALARASMAGPIITGSMGVSPLLRTLMTLGEAEGKVQIRPRSANESGVCVPATMKWSRTRTSTRARADFKVLVSVSSAVLGSATPDGWL